MKRLLLIAGFALAFCVGAFGQTTTVDPLCPGISVTGPAGITEPGGTAAYTLDITNEQGKAYEYIWSVSSGEIVSGQGTKSILVKTPENHAGMTATVQVKGTPVGCANLASESSSCCDRAPSAVKLAQFNGSKSLVDRRELDKITMEMNDNPNNQLYVYFAYKKEPVDRAALKREQSVSAYLAKAIGDASRVAIVRLFNGVDLVQFWRVPPGADKPECEGCAPTSDSQPVTNKKR